MEKFEHFGDQEKPKESKYREGYDVREDPVAGYFNRIHDKIMDPKFMKLEGGQKAEARGHFIEELAQEMEKDLKSENPEVRELASANIRDIIERFFLEWEG